MKFLFSIVLVTIMAFPQSVFAQANEPPKPPAWVQRSNENAQILLKILAKYAPESAGRLGVDGLDEQIVDLKANLFERSDNDMHGAIVQLKGKLAHETDPSVKQDLTILIKSAEDNIKGNDMSLKYEIPYFDMAGLVFGGMRGLLDDQIPAERRKAAVVRLKRYVGMEEGYTPITVLAQDRIRERLSKPGLIGPVKAQVERDMSTEKFYIDGIADLFKQYQITGYEEAYEKLKIQLAAYHEFVQKEIMPKTREDFRLPAEEYAFTLEQVGVDIPPEELVKKAHAAFVSYQTEMQSVAAQVAKERGYSFTDYRDVIKELKKEQLVGDSILPFYKRRIRDIESIIRREHLVTLPERDMRIRIASPAEAAQIPAPNMRPPRLIGNTGEMGEFILPLNIPAPPGSDKKSTMKYDDFTFAAAAWTLTAHEGRPGHELQFASIIEKGVSTTRALFAFNSTNVEGWGLYSEKILEPFMPLEGKLISLQHRLLRSARAFLDPQLQLGQMTKEEAMKILQNDVVVSDVMANQEVERYTFRSPGQATAYFYGFTKLMELRADVEKNMGIKFDQQKFHDFVLAQGLLSPQLLRDAVMNGFVATQ
jgi:hypothetical protein